MTFIMLFANSACVAQPQVCFKGQCVTVDIAQTPEERNSGLQFRKSLGADQGMLFLFEQSAQYAFWMKDTKIPLDIIWLDDNKQIVYIASNLPPCVSTPCPSYIPPQKAKYVLELNAGKAAIWPLNIGDQLELNIKEKP